MLDEFYNQRMMIIKDDKWAYLWYSLAHYHQNGNKLLDYMVTGIETWAFYKTPETKHQSIPNCQQNWNILLTGGKWWWPCFEIEGILLIDFMPKRTDDITLRHMSLLWRARCFTVSYLHIQQMVWNIVRQHHFCSQ